MQNLTTKSESTKMTCLVAVQDFSSCSGRQILLEQRNVFLSGIVFSAANSPLINSIFYRKLTPKLFVHSRRPKEFVITAPPFAERQFPNYIAFQNGWQISGNFEIDKQEPYVMNPLPQQIIFVKMMMNF